MKNRRLEIILKTGKLGACFSKVRRGKYSLKLVFTLTYISEKITLDYLIVKYSDFRWAYLKMSPANFLEV